MRNIREMMFEKLQDISKETPEKIAIELMDETITYRDVDKIVNGLAGSLKKLLGNENFPIAVRLRNKKETLLVMLALIKVGKSILPLPYEIPDEKASSIIRGISPQALISETQELLRLSEELIFIGVDNLFQQKDVHFKEEGLDQSRRIFCILMTSGTTGSPKGCQLSDQAFLGRISDLATEYPMSYGDKFLFSGNYSFDVTFTQMFCWLYGEGTLVIQSEEDKFNQLPLYITKFQVTHIAISPSILKYIYTDIRKVGQSLKYVFVAGEKFPVEIAKEYLRDRPSFKLLNLYGPTEFSIYALEFDVSNYEGEKSVPIGKALRGVEVILMNEENEIIQEEDIEGEIVLLGKGIFDGYINSLKDNNTKRVVINGEKAYKTGDTGYYSNDLIYFVGRKDNQFKINGVRVEAEDIEQKILKCNFLIKEVIVNYESYKKGNVLVAYIVWKDRKRRTSEKEIINNLKGSVEKYFFPRFVIAVDEIPLNKNGKIDRTALHQTFLEGLSRSSTSKTYQNTHETTYNSLKNIWESTLGFPLKNQKADFFLSGGDSLDSVMMIAELESVFDIRVSEEEFIRHSSFEQLLSFVSGGSEKEKEVAGDLEFCWEDFGEELTIKDGEKILSVSGDFKLYELINSGLSDFHQATKIYLTDKVRKKKAQVVLKFPLFSRQEFYLRKNFDSILESSLVFEYPNYPKILASLNKFIKSQQLTRSLIQNNEFIEFSFEPQGPRGIEFIDLVALTPEKSKFLLDSKIQEIKSNLLSKSPSEQMVKFLLVRESFNRLKLHLLVSHHIADAASINVFKKQIVAYYDKNEEYENIPKYSAFIKSVISANNSKTILDLSESKYYQDIKLANDSFRKYFAYDTSVIFSEYQFKLNVKNKEERGNLLFAKLASLVSYRTGANAFAFQILKNLRHFGGNDYTDIFADIHCSIYTSYCINKEEDQKLFSKSERDLKNIYEEQGIHIDYLTSSDRFYDSPLISSFEETFLNINYLGEIKNSEVPALIEELKLSAKNLSKLHSSKLRFTCFSSGNQGYLISLGGFMLEDKET